MLEKEESKEEKGERGRREGEEKGMWCCLQRQRIHVGALTLLSLSVHTSYPSGDKHLYTSFVGTQHGS